MIEISLSTNLNAPADKVWNLVGGFNDLPKWHPAVQDSELENGGKTRRLLLVGGGRLVEELVDADEEGRSYTYRIVENGPLPVADYQATIRVEDAEGGSRLTWSGKFEPVGDPMAARSAIEGVYQAGLDHVSSVLKSAA